MSGVGCSVCVCDGWVSGWGDGGGQLAAWCGWVWCRAVLVRVPVGTFTASPCVQSKRQRV